MYLSVSVDYVYAPVVVKQDRIVVIEASYLALFPWAVYILRAVEISLVSIICDKAYVEESFMISEARGPHALSVDIGAVLHPLGRCTVKSVIYVRGMLPVCQIVGAQDLAARHEVHGGADHVVSIADPYHIRVGIIRSGYGVSGGDVLHMVFSSDRYDDTSDRFAASQLPRSDKHSESASMPYKTGILLLPHVWGASLK